MHLNPDTYLQTSIGRVFTPERNAAAWEMLYADLTAELLRSSQQIFMVIGVQGSGKSTWIRKASESNDVIYVDSTFATVQRRSRAIEIAKAANVSISAVWVQVKLETAYRRNRRRATDEVVPDEAIENVFRIFEPPSLDEGFCAIVVIDEDFGAAR